MSFGMDSTGFNKKKLTDVKASLEENLKAVFGIINTNPESTFGQLIGVIADAEAKLWDLAEDVYFSQYPVSAEGVPLDNAVDLTGITRLDASSSFVEAILEGDQGTVVPIGTQFKQINTEEIFESDVAVTINKITVLKSVIKILNTGLGNDYDVTINGSTTETDTASTDPNTILDLMRTELIAAEPDFTFTHDTTNEELIVLITDSITEFSIDVNAALELSEIWTPVQVSALNTGVLPVSANSITTIETPVSGLNSIDNLLDGTIGRDVETDDELRLRRKQSLRVTGSASVPAIEARLGNDVTGVTAVTVIENASDATDLDGRPPHSFEAIVAGGDEQEIAEKIWEVKGAGINTHSGNVPPIEKQVQDSQGTFQVIRFSRPILKYVHMSVEISLYSEESFPTGGELQVEAALKAFGDTLAAGDDLIIQRFFSPVYTVDGVLNIEKFEFAITEVDEAVAVKATGDATGAQTPFQLFDSEASYIGDGVIEGMVIRNTDDDTYAVILNVIDAENLLLSADIMDSGEAYEIGVFGPVNIPIASNQIGDYNVSRITVTTV